MSAKDVIPIIGRLGLRQVAGLFLLLFLVSEGAWASSVPSGGVDQSSDSAWTSPQGDQDLAPQRRGSGPPARGVYKTRINPHWFQHDTRFWYRNDLREDTKEFIVVDTETGARQPAFDHQALASALSKAVGETYQGERLPFSEFDFIDAGIAVRVEFGGKAWRWDPRSQECVLLSTNSPLQSASVAATNANEAAEQKRQAQVRGRKRDPSDTAAEEPSPDDHWTAFIKGDNVSVRSRDGKEYKLTQDGEWGDTRV